MAKTKWNEQQLEAITAHGGTILVSAAAGSGKTAVLAERVVSMLAGDDAQHMTDADRLLIVTFSNAAADEMKERIGVKLDERIAKDPTSVRLQKQRLLLQSAMICTMHSFCSRIVKENFHTLGIAPDFRIADDSEISLIGEGCVQRIVDSYYEAGSEAFDELAQLVSGRRSDDAIAQTVKRLAEFADADPFPLVMLERIKTLYCSGSSIWRETVIEYSKEKYRLACRMLERAIESAQRDDGVSAAFMGALTKDKEAFESVAGLYDTDADEVRIKIKTLKKNRRGKTADSADGRVLERTESLRNAAWNSLFEAGDELCCSKTEEEEDTKALAPVIGVLCDMTRDYINALTAEKRRKNILYFGDLEHLAVELLIDRSSGELKRTDAAREISSRFDEILLDEYQDTSAVQDMIFRAVAKEKGDVIADGEENLFIVGDVKQSIYRFRRAVSALFTDRFTSYSDYKKEAPAFPARIVLAKNYRSRPEVTETVNFIFRRMMSERCGEIDYTSQQLEAAASYPSAQKMESEIHLLGVVKQDEGGDRCVTEARFIAKKIRSMIDDGFEVMDKASGKMRPCRAGDFCVMRYAIKGEHGQTISNELARVGLGSVLSAETGFFDRPEIVTALSLLRIIDDPLQEVELLNVLCSPMFAFSADDLAAVRLALPKGNLFSALDMAAKNGNEKCARFIEKISYFRTLSSTYPADRLISAALRETGFMSAVLSQSAGKQRQDNLKMLISHAEKYEGAGYRGLSGFIRFADSVAENGGDMEAAMPSAGNGDVVHVMTIHKSKGLEFPICIVCGLGSSTAPTDSGMMFHTSLGIGSMRRADDGKTKFETVQHRAIVLSEKAAELGEDVRLLYVALTRAREKLILVASYQNAENAVKSAAMLADGEMLDPAAMKSCWQHGTWLTACAMQHPDAGILREISGTDIVSTDATTPLLVQIHTKEEMEAMKSTQTEGKQETKAQADEEMVREFSRRMDWQCPALSLRDVPSKVTASSLHRYSEKNVTASSRPAFMDETGLTATQKGSALHKFMEKADPLAAAESIENEISRLCDAGIMSEAERKVLDRKKLDDFFSGEGGRLMKAAKEIMREKQFSAILPKEYHLLFTTAQTSEAIVIEGACDCVLIFDEGAVIIDYKSDRMYEPEQFVSDYGDQLRLYRAAMEQVLELPVIRTVIWSFSLSRFIDVK